ncbi:helix-turn-helix domain-containing protein [Streptomyces sp. NPDC059271]|uniref:helix-turn-helix domain-containing protein n=1 Tax=Streptomyces sp. NPDC059271 TaxID=3346799 RepID=UPI0036CEFC52
MSKTAERLRSRIRARHALPSPDQRAALRKAAGLTLQEVATAVGVTRGAVWHWEQGSREPRGDLLGRYLLALEVMDESA